jgi:CRP-like cAMP-binding protein
VIGSLQVSQAELAAYIGATRETASTVLNQLQREGTVLLEHRSIQLVPQKAALAMGAIG